MPIPMLIDTDVGSDDAVALILAFRSSRVDVRAVTTVSGNVHAVQAATNALVVAEICGDDAPVHVGAHRPLVRPWVDATGFHGRDGLGDRGYPAPARQAERVHAVDAILATARDHPGLLLVTLGPLTNVALALRKDPGLVARISRCVVMGGGVATYGNVTPAAEYNVWVDPEAARIVFLSGFPIEMVGWEFCRDEFALTPEEVEQVRALDTPFARFAVDCNTVAMRAFEKQTGQAGLSLPDAVAMAVALEPSVATRTAKHFVDVELGSELTRGATVVDLLDVAEEPENRDVWRETIAAGKNVSVARAIDVRRWKEMLRESLS